MEDVGKLTGFPSPSKKQNSFTAIIQMMFLNCDIVLHSVRVSLESPLDCKEIQPVPPKGILS